MTGGQQLYYAAREGNLDTIQDILSNGRVHPDSFRGHYGRTPLIEASMGGHLEAVKMLVSHGADVRATSIPGWSALHGAAVNGHFGVAKWLVEVAGALECLDIQEEFSDHTPAELARQYDHIHLADYLSDIRTRSRTCIKPKQGNDVNFTSRTAAQGSKCNDRETQNVCLPNLPKGGMGKRPSPISIPQSPTHKQVHEKTLSRSQPVNVPQKCLLDVQPCQSSLPGKTRSNTSLLHGSVIPKTTATGLVQTASCVHKCSESKDDIHQNMHTPVITENKGTLHSEHKNSCQSMKDHRQSIPLNQSIHESHSSPHLGRAGAMLYSAIEDGNVYQVHIILESKIHPDAFRGWSDWTGLMVAARTGNEEIVQALISAGASVQLCDITGATALHHSAYYGHLRIAQVLMEAGAHRCLLMECQPGHKTPVQLAHERGHSSVYNYLVNVQKENLDYLQSRSLRRRKRHLLLVPKERIMHDRIIQEMNVDVLPWKDDTKYGKLIEDEMVYNMTSKPRGVALIININRTIGYREERHGSMQDVCKMEQLFSQLYFDTEIYIDLDSKELMNVLKDMATDPALKKHDCFVLCLMGHGQQGAILASDGRSVKIDVITDLFSNQSCPQLFGKPKLLLIQCCRGILRDFGAEPMPFEMDDVEYKLPDKSDMFIMYSTTEGHISQRDRKSGCVFIQTVADVFANHACEKTLPDLATRVTGQVSAREMGGTMMFEPCYKQCPELAGSLRKDFFFFPGKMS